MKQILIIDDDISINDMLDKVLARAGYETFHAWSGTEALLFLKDCGERKPDLILLDLMLPGLSGEELLPQIGDVPVIVMSARTDVRDKVNVLLAGAADYITKPFEIEELLARISVQLRGNRAGRRHEESKSEVYGEITLDPGTRLVRAGGEEVHLTKTEYAILKLLMENPRQVITRTAILDRISEDTLDCTESSLKVHVSNLRKKLRQATGRDYIEAVWGIGFKLKNDHGCE